MLALPCLVSTSGSYAIWDEMNGYELIVELEC